MQQYTGASYALLSNVSYGTSYASSGAILCERMNKLTLYVNSTPGDATAGRLNFQFSPDNTNWYDYSVKATVASGTVVLATQQLAASAGAYRIILEDVNDPYFRVQYQRVSSTSGGTLSIKVVDGRS